jgi:phage terminase large subunit-like protein
VCEAVESQTAHNIALIGPTFADVRDVMVEGKSGIVHTATKCFRPKFEPSRRRLVWPNGAVAMLFSAEVPDSLRGPQFDLAWGDELAAWPDGSAVFDVLRPAMRIGENPRMMFTTTPRPVAWVKELLADESCVLTRSATHENIANLAPGVVQDLAQRYQNSAFARQELYGELIDDPEGAIWCRADIEKARNQKIPDQFDRIIIAVDPPITSGHKADACGIIVAGSYQDGNITKAAILADLTIKGQKPEVWAKVISDTLEQFDADAIVAESNQGGEMLLSVLRIAIAEAPIHLVHATKSKRKRAEPVNLLYSQNRIAHAGYFADLEDEMCRFGAAGFTQSPDRLDAMVWAVSHLLLGHNNRPRARVV